MTLSFSLPEAFLLAKTNKREKCKKQKEREKEELETKKHEGEERHLNSGRRIKPPYIRTKGKDTK